MWSTFLGRSLEEAGHKIQVYVNNDVIVVGETNSNDFPVKNAYCDTYNGSDEVFLAKFSENGDLIWSTYLGGTRQDIPRNLAVNSLK